MHEPGRKRGRTKPEKPGVETKTEAPSTPECVQEGESSEARPWLKWSARDGWCLHLPFSRLSAAWIAWTLCAVGLVSSISKRTVQRWLAADRLRPWRFRSWITPKDLTAFLERARGVLDLYARVRTGTLAPDEVAYSIDEKTSIQGRRRASHRPAAKGGKPAKVEHSYVREGAVQLLAALDLAVGRITSHIYQQATTFLIFSGFLETLILNAVAAGKRKIHIVLDNGSAHRPKYLKTWLQDWLEARQLAHVEVIVHWLPVRSSWLNQVEIFFSLLQSQALTPNNFSSLEKLSERIRNYISLWNARPRPFDWTYTSEDLDRQFSEKARAAAASAQVRRESASAKKL